MDLVLRAMDVGVEVKTIHNASIMSAVAACGLSVSLYGITFLLKRVSLSLS